MRILLRTLALSIFMACPWLIAQATNTAKLCNEGDTIVSGPASFQAQAGVVGAVWTPLQTVTKLPVTLSWASGAPVGWPADPDPNVVKVIYVLETSTAQTFTVKSAAGVTSTVVIPALPAPPIVLLVTCTTTVTITGQTTTTANSTCTAVKQ